MAPRLSFSPSTISTLTAQILSALLTHPPSSPRFPSLPLPLPLPSPLLHSLLSSPSLSPLLSLRLYLHLSTLPSPLSSHSLSIFSSFLLPSLPLLLSPPPPFPLTLSSFRSLFSLYLHSPPSLSPPFPPLSLLKSMQFAFKIKPDSFCYNAVIRLSEPDESLSLYREMIKQKISPNVITYVSLVKSLAKIGEVKSARELISEMSLYNCKPNVVVYTSFLGGLCKFGDLDSAIEILRKMEGNLGRECEPNIVTYTCLMKCLIENSRFDEALNVLDRMVKRGVKLNRVFVRTVLKGFCIGERADEVERMIGELMLKDPMEIYDLFRGLCEKRRL
ncbi:hypothetical protein LUZ60_006114 [Juncus effusus]|nr:hypothetical protein LUZ60_006114 [Juncus effusus]